MAKKSKKKSKSFSRTKGHDFERDVAVKLRRIFPQACRQLEYQENQCKGVDLANTGDYRFQLKKLKAYSPISAIEEVQLDAFEKDCGVTPVLITAGNFKTPMAVIPLEKFLDLLHIEKLYAHEAQLAIERSKRSKTYGK